MGPDAPLEPNGGVVMAFYKKDEIVGWWCESEADVVCNECMDSGVCADCPWFSHLEPVVDSGDPTWIITCDLCHKHMVE